MALTSPGVEVTIIDESNYAPAQTNSVPFVLVATAQNKANAAGTGVAPGTIAANANKVYKVTSQRDLVSLYGNPFFYKTTNGTPIQGYELNEYGLLAAYSTLGVTNGIWVLRADIDLASLVGTLSRPKGNPVDGTYWLDTTTTTWGIYEFNKTTGKFTEQVPLVIVNSSDLIGGYPKSNLGNVGSYAVNAIDPVIANPYNQSTYFYKNGSNTWVQLGTREWRASVPAITGTVSNPTLTAGQTFTITTFSAPLNYSTVVAVPAAPNNTVSGVATAINDLGLTEITASVISGRLNIYFAPNLGDIGKTPSLVLSSSSTVLADLGINSTQTYYPLDMVSGPSSQMPLWTSGQTKPHPTGSVWLKTSITGNGINLVVQRFSTTAGAFVQTPVSVYQNVSLATVALDATGGRLIPAGTVVAVQDTLADNISNNLYLYERAVTGPTVITGNETNPSLPNGAVIYAYPSAPKSTFYGNGNNSYTVTLPAAGPVSSDEFVTAWLAANIPNTTAKVTTDGAIQITHTLGGEIALVVEPNQPYSNVLDLAGLSYSVNSAVASAAGAQDTYTSSQYSTTGAGTGLSLNVLLNGNYYIIDSISSGGSSYNVGDRVTFLGSSLGGVDVTDNLTVQVTAVSSGIVTSAAWISGKNNSISYASLLTNWNLVSYTANEGAPFTNPVNNTNWFYSVVGEVDIMINQAGVWKGYRNVNYDSAGNPITTGTNATDPNGPITSATAPTTQSDGTALVYGDLWLDTSDLENYPVISRWQSVDSVDQWILIDNTDQTSGDGIVFADARWAGNGTTDPVNDPIPTIVSLLTSNYLDLDAPDPDLYPQGMLLFNSRRSGYNVKQFRSNYFNSLTFGDVVLPTVKNAWVSTSGLKNDGSPYMGRKAQRAMVVQALNASIATNQTIREEDNFFNLISCPNYPELQPQMVALNNERGNTGYIIGDTPMRLSDQATDIEAWAKNSAGAASTGEDGCVTRDEYMGLFYPSGLSTDLTGTPVAVPPSHMMLRTFLRNDTIAYPWLAPAGTRRGTIDNATSIGYVDSATGEFQVIKNRVGIRDVLYSNFINPLAFFTSVGLLNYGNKNSKDTQSALDRINVARLVCYIREKLNILARPFVFEPNDSLTRSQITSVVQTLFVDLVAKRGIYDYLVVCDGTNNTPARIDANQLWIDIAIEPVKAAEFIYIPVRIMNTGEIAARGSAIFG
jgi:hypothetical protein